MTNNSLAELIAKSINSINEKDYEKIIFVDSYVKDGTDRRVTSLFSYEDDGTWGEYFGNVFDYDLNDVESSMWDHSYRVKTSPDVPDGWDQYEEGGKGCTAMFVLDD